MKKSHKVTKKCWKSKNHIIVQSSWLLSFLLLTTCGMIDTTINHINLSFAVTLESGDLLEISVFQGDVATCKDLNAASVDQKNPREARQQAVAKDLETGKIETLLKDLPAETKLTFYARIKRPAIGTMAEDCKDGVVLKESEETKVELAFAP